MSGYTDFLVGGFSESAMLQKILNAYFSNKIIIIPEDAGLVI